MVRTVAQSIPMATRSGKIRGGLKAKAYLHKIRAAQSLSRSVQVGFFRDSRYATGEYVARVAMIHEFGFGGYRERPFFRDAIKGADKVLMPILKAELDPRTLVLTPLIAGRLGLVMSGRVQESVTKWHVIDTGKLRRSVSWVVK